MRRLLLVLAAVALSCIGGFADRASAQLLDSVEVTSDGTNALVRIKFQVLVQYIRHVPANEGSLIQVYFQITARGEDPARGVVEEQRRPNPTDLVPSLTVTYPSQAPSQLRRIDVQFASPVRFRLRTEGTSTFVFIIPLTDEQIAKLKPQGLRLPPSAVAAEPTSDVERQAAGLARDARAALEAGEFERAVVLLNRLLNLPPNAWSQEAQEQIGLARERLDEIAKAKAEYELYLKLYPDGPGADRIRQRLAALATAPAVAAAARPGALTYWGSVSQYYYGGQSRATTTTTTVTPATGATTIDTASLSGVDQSQLSNTVDLTARYRDATWDSRAVVRDSYLVNFLKGVGNQNQLNALFFETRHQPTQLMGRFGRQSATTGGVLGLFDGAVGAWGFADNWRLGAVVGQPVEAQLGGTNKTFYGANVEAENIGEQVGRQHLRDPAERIRIRGSHRRRWRAPLLRGQLERLFALRLRHDVQDDEHRHGAGKHPVPDRDVGQPALRLPAHADPAAHQCAGRRSVSEHRVARADARTVRDPRPREVRDSDLARRVFRRHPAADAALAARRRLPDLVAGRNAFVRDGLSWHAVDRQRVHLYNPVDFEQPDAVAGHPGAQRQRPPFARYRRGAARARFPLHRVAGPADRAAPALVSPDRRARTRRSPGRRRVCTCCGASTIASRSRRKPTTRSLDTRSPVIVDDVRRYFYYVGWRWDL